MCCFRCPQVDKKSLSKLSQKCSASVNNLLHMLTTGHVGVPLPCNIVKLEDVEEMNYMASNGEGEVSQLGVGGGGTRLKLPVQREVKEQD